MRMDLDRLTIVDDITTMFAFSDVKVSASALKHLPEDEKDLLSAYEESGIDLLDKTAFNFEMADGWDN